MKLGRLIILTMCFITGIILPVAHGAAEVYGKSARLTRKERYDFRRATILQAYYQALKSDPTFKKATADWDSAKQDLPIARAAYLTQIGLTGNAQRQYNNSAPQLFIPNSNGYNYDYGFVLTVSQPVFNLPAWDAIKSAKASVKSATATYLFASQDLMRRTVRAYVFVLQAYDRLRFQLARKRAVYEQLKVAREQFKVGLIAITGVYDARAVYDQAVALSISDQNDLNDRLEDLAVITGIHYLRLRGIGQRVPLVSPKPNDINTWADVAVSQNYQLMAQNYAVLAARETLKQQSVSWMPQLSLQGTYTNDNQSSLDEGNVSLPRILSVIPSIRTNNVLYGMVLNFPVVQGGLVTANTRQAQYNYLSASDQREFIYRSVISQTRQSFLGIVTGISKVKADWQSVISARNALEATKAGYEVGTRTMVDVLDDVTALYQAQQQYADDQYLYILNSIELKYNAGTLSVKDIKTINGWLKKNIRLNLPEAALKSLQTRLRPIRPFPHQEQPKYRKLHAQMKGRKPKERTPPSTPASLPKRPGEPSEKVAESKRQIKQYKEKYDDKAVNAEIEQLLSQAFDPITNSVMKTIMSTPKIATNTKTVTLPKPLAVKTKRITIPAPKSTTAKVVRHRRRLLRRRAPSSITQEHVLPKPAAKMTKHRSQQLSRQAKITQIKIATPKHKRKLLRVYTLPKPAAKMRQTVSLDERIIPLYEFPAQKKGVLPSPS